MVAITRFQNETQFPNTSSVREAIDLSVVIPVFNEVENVGLVYERLKSVLDTLPQTSEIIFVDDGSDDGTYDILREIPNKDRRVWIIRLRKNFGQSAAFSAGFDYSSGDVIVTMDGDLQNDPQDIPKLLQKIDEGFDIASGWRIRRKDYYLTRRLPSIAANTLISKVTGVTLHDYGCSLKAYRREVVKNIRLYGELHRFIPALASWMGVRVTEVPVNHFPRRFGRSKYGLGRTLKVFLDLITVKFLLDYATRPLQIFGLAGIFSFISGTALALYLTIQRLFYGIGLSNRPILLLAILLIMLGVQFIVMGLLGELIVRIYHESQDKPIYMVRSIVRDEDFENNERGLLVSH
jgi:glycosyltransferase involved in cell wall biosynthesis